MPHRSIEERIDSGYVEPSQNSLIPAVSNYYVRKPSRLLSGKVNSSNAISTPTSRYAKNIILRNLIRATASLVEGTSRSIVRFLKARLLAGLSSAWFSNHVCVQRLPKFFAREVFSSSVTTSSEELKIFYHFHNADLEAVRCDDVKQQDGLRTEDSSDERGKTRTTSKLFAG